MCLKSRRKLVLQVVKSVDPIGVGPGQAESEYDDLANFLTRQLEVCQSFAQFESNIAERLEISRKLQNDVGAPAIAFLG
jgi:hypothetical protein